MLGTAQNNHLYSINTQKTILKCFPVVAKYHFTWGKQKKVKLKVIATEDKLLENMI